jgi:tRNA-dihydrouridine synthase A
MPMPTHKLDRRLSVAPMMDWTDRHFRYFLRLISSRTLLFSEMLHARAVLQGDRKLLLDFSPEEQPVALQLGGSDPEALAAAARIGAEAGYREINLNVGCPSDRVQAGRFGACLMKESDTVAACVESMAAAVDIPVTVKCRIGVDDIDSESHLLEFIGGVAEAGCRVFAIHARKAWLQGLNPRQNREIPSLDYGRVRRVKRHFPDLAILVNGGVRSLDQVADLLQELDGVMIGREACNNPWMLAEADRRIFGADTAPESREAVADAYAAYAGAMHATGTPKSVLLRNLHGLFQGVPGARRWRRALSDGMADTRPPDRVIRDALSAMAAIAAA